jgi:hypothetical protein
MFEPVGQIFFQVFTRDVQQGWKDLCDPGLGIMIVEADFHGVRNWLARMQLLKIAVNSC